MCFLNACARRDYRIDADREVYGAIAERNVDPRWQIDNYDIEIDPRSRYFDPYDPDRPPMPPDDPAAHQYMQRVNGISGWKHWSDNGHRWELENPTWRQELASYVDFTEDGKINLTLDSALKLAYIHSPRHQRELETLYLSALDVTTERFRLSSQYTGGVDAVYQHDGQLRPGGEQNTLSVGRGSGALPFPGGGSGSNALQLDRRFASAGELMVGIANSFTMEFTQGDINFASSVLNASIVQPLLRGAGKDIALERLTIVERSLLYNVRGYHEYRQGFFSFVAVGEGPGGSLNRRGGLTGGTGLTGFSGQGAGGTGNVARSSGGGGGGNGGGGGSNTGFAGGGAGTVGGFFGLTQVRQELRNTQESLKHQERTLRLLLEYKKSGAIDQTQVDQFRQSIETEKAQLLQKENGYISFLEGYQRSVLGLPPDLPVEIDDEIIQPFQLVTPAATNIQDEIAHLQTRVGNTTDATSAAEFAQIIDGALRSIVSIENQLVAVDKNIGRMEQAAPGRAASMNASERLEFQQDREGLRLSRVELGTELDQSKRKLAVIREGLTEANKVVAMRELPGSLGDLYRQVQSLILIQARAKLESITLDQVVDLRPEDAYRIALANRLDLMSSRASLVDQWRLIAFNADALQANVSIAASGEMRTTSDNPLSFDARNSSVRAGLQFDAPFTRLLERNNYRQSLIDYQRRRRSFIQERDRTNAEIRGLLRQLEVHKKNLEIQRRAVAIAIQRVDQTSEKLIEPPKEPNAKLGDTAATNLLTALSDLRNSQNNFMSVWLNYYATRMQLSRALGIMRLDKNGGWIDLPMPKSSPSQSSPVESGPIREELPPQLPTQWIDLANHPSGSPELVKRLPATE